VKGVGSKAIEAVITAREESGPFTSLHEFLPRVRGQVVNRKVLESLIACGAFDSIERNARGSGPPSTTRSDGPRCGPRSGRAAARPLRGARRRRSTRLRRPCRRASRGRPRRSSGTSAEAIGFFITGHPLDRYLKDLRKFTNITVGTLRTRGPELPVVHERPGREGRPKVRIGGVINSIRLRNSKRGER